MPETPSLTLEAASHLLSHPPRWRILFALAPGETLPVREIARRARFSAVYTSKHLIFMKDAGLVVPKYGTCYQLAPAYLPAPGTDVIDLGPCLIKLPPADPAA